MNSEEALNKLDETLIGDLELKVVLSKALELQIPKKVNEKSYEVVGVCRYEEILCPVCGAWVYKYLVRRQTYCHKCGQKLDWGR